MCITVRVRCINCKVDPLSPQPNPAVANIKASITAVNDLRVSLSCSMKQVLLPCRGQCSTVWSLVYTDHCV